MADASTIALVSVVATGLVGLAAPVASHFSQKQQFQKERDDKDLDDLRQLLDSSAQVIGGAMEAAAAVSGDIGDGKVESPEGEKHVETLRKCVVAVMDSAQRIAIRLGREHEITKSYWRFWAKVAELLEASGKPVGEVTMKQLDEMRQATKDERNLFLGKAAVVAGSHQYAVKPRG